MLVTALVVLGLDAAAFQTDLAAIPLLREELAGHAMDEALTANADRNWFLNGRLYPVAAFVYVFCMSGWSYAMAQAFRAHDAAAPFVPSGACLSWIVPVVNLVSGPALLAAFARHVAADDPVVRLRLQACAFVALGAWVLAWMAVLWTWAYFMVQAGTGAVATEAMIAIKQVGLLGSGLEAVAIGAMVATVLGIHTRWSYVRSRP